MNGMKARQAAHAIITEWFKGDRYLEHIMKLENKDLSLVDKRFAESLVHHVITYHRTLETVLKQYIKRRPNKRIYTVILMGACEICFMNVKDHAAIYTSVELAEKVQHGSKGFVNAVLRRVLQFHKTEWADFMQDESISLGERYSFPDWMILRWEDQFGDELPQLLDSLNQTPSKMARIIDTEHKEEIISELNDLGALDKLCDYHSDYIYLTSWQAVLEHPLFKQGKLIAQDVSAAWPVELMRAAAPGKTVLDLCSAPGGKLSGLRQYLPPHIKIKGYDVAIKRLTQVGEMLHRLDMSNVDLEVADAVDFKYPQADGILIDAPCSGFGVIRKRSDLRWRRKEKDMDQLVDLQKKILNNAAGYLKKGGVMVYSTCTFDLQENEKQIQDFLTSHTNFRVFTAAAEKIPAEFITETGAVVCFPHKHLCEGSFAIALEKY